MTEENNNYVVYCHTTPDGMKYYGVTCNVKQRWKPSHYKRQNAQFKDAIERFGWKNITHEVLYSGLTRDEALKIEDGLIMKARENGNSFNSNRSGHYQQTDEFKEEEKARSKAWREVHKEERKAYYKAYCETHKEERVARSKAWREVHKEERKAYYKAYCEANKEKENARSKAYYEANKEKKKAYHKAWAEANREKLNAYQRERRKRNRGSKQAVLERFRTSLGTCSIHHTNGS